jgi:hypothetical protein
MSAFRTLSAALVVAALAACGGEPPAEEAAQAEVQAAAETAAAPSPCYIAGGTPEEALTRPSPLAQAAFALTGAEGTLCYGAPSVKGRKIMGELVPFGEPWRLGANEATAFHLTAATDIGGVVLQPGTYSFYAIPGETEWTFVLNSAADRWGIPIDDSVRATDVGSFAATVEATEAPVETLAFRFEAAADGSAGELVMEWESTRVRIPVRPARASAPAM